MTGRLPSRTFLCQLSRVQYTLSSPWWLASTASHTCLMSCSTDHHTNAADSCVMAGCSMTSCRSWLRGLDQHPGLDLASAQPHPPSASYTPSTPAEMLLRQPPSPAARQQQFDVDLAVVLIFYCLNGQALCTCPNDEAFTVRQVADDVQ